MIADHSILKQLTIFGTSEENGVRDMIKIKGIFGDWVEVEHEKARDYVIALKNQITVGPDDQKIAYINKNRLHGITVEELLK